MEHPKTEQTQRDKCSTRVRTLEITDSRNFVYPLDRKSHLEGKIVDYSNSHGLCFRVLHDDGTSAWYNPDELEEIDESYHRNIKHNTDGSVSAETPDGWSMHTENMESLPWHVSPNEIKLVKCDFKNMSADAIKHANQRVAKMLERLKKCKCQEDK